MLISATGSRQLAVKSISEQLRILEVVKTTLADLNATLVYSGGAEGFDACVARAAYDLGIPYELWLPNPGYIDYYWRGHSITGKDRSAQSAQMLGRAADVHFCCVQLYEQDPHNPIGPSLHSNFIRNHHLLKDADHALVYQPTSSGTKQGVKELQLHEVPWTEIK